MSIESSDLSVWQAARRRLGAETVRHRHFVATANRLREAMACHRLALLIGPPGVGKSLLVDCLVAEANGAVRDRPSQYRAVVATAPAPHRRAFSWKDFWIALLTALDDPLPHHKVDRIATVEALARAPAARLRRMTEGQLLHRVSSAARDRGLEALFIDEAVELVKAEQGRMLRDQLDVLRNLADLAGFQLVLVSTPRILPSLQLSGELLRRTAEVYFPRYLAEGPAAASEYRDFCRVFATFIRSLPEGARYHPDPEQLRLLHAGSLGCVGHLADWLKRVLRRAESEGTDCLEWSHFEGTVLVDAKLAKLEEESRRGEERIAEASVRTFGLGPALRHPDSSSATAPDSSSSSERSTSGGRSRTGRVGLPKPKRRRVA